MTNYFNDYQSAAKKIVEHIGKNIVLGIPLGIGKPIGFLNALYELASNDKSINLTILTGLTLTRPTLHNELQKRFINPILDRLLGTYEDPAYEKFRLRDQLPKNIKVIEFYLTPGKYLHNKNVQQNYISASYTNVISDALNHSINVIAQQVAISKSNPNHYSLSSNTDLFFETINHLKQEKEAGKKVAMIAEANAHLPFMTGNAVVEADIFTDIIDTKNYKTLFAIPKSRLSPQDHLIGLYSSLLVKDGGCLQIGIGRLGEAVANALILRHKDNSLYQAIFKELNAHQKFGDTISKIGSLLPFEDGLYSSTEMLSDGCMELYKEKIIKKRVYDHVGLQNLLNSKKITEKITPDLVDILIDHQIIQSPLTQSDFDFLQQWGILTRDTSYSDGNFILTSGEKIKADLKLSDTRKLINIGGYLTSGKVIHTGFFIGSSAFYQQLKNLSAEELNQIEMTSVMRTNRIEWSSELSKAQRQHARLINTAMMITTTGTIISDGLKNWNEVSGVGGQFEFALMGQQLPQARFIINCLSTRKNKGKVESNILWEFPNTTLPRFLRDIIVTEYGIADCRSKTDSDIIKAILNITDSRFQETLLKKAKKSGKISDEYEIPTAFQNNHPENINAFIQDLQSKGFCKAYPFGSDLTKEENIIQDALLFLKNSKKIKLFFIALFSFFIFESEKKFKSYLIRMNLERPKTIKEYFYKKILLYALKKEKIQ